jgi:hypothetical protein
LCTSFRIWLFMGHRLPWQESCPVSFVAFFIARFNRFAIQLRLLNAETQLTYSFTQSSDTIAKFLSETTLKEHSQTFFIQHGHVNI